MGAEQSLERGKVGRGLGLKSLTGNNRLTSEASSNAAPTRYNSAIEGLPVRHASIENLSEEFKQLLKEKQEEFHQMVKERRQMQIEIMANEIVNSSILEACSEVLTNTIGNEALYIADGLAWKSVALGATRLLEDASVESK